MWKYLPTNETAPLFLYNPIKLATYSYFKLKGKGRLSVHILHYHKGAVIFMGGGPLKTFLNGLGGREWGGGFHSTPSPWVQI